MRYIPVPLSELEGTWASEFEAVYITAGAQNLLAPHNVRNTLARFKSCDWGSCDEHNHRVNDQAANEIAEGGRSTVLAVYQKEGQDYWVIYDVGHVITILLPEEY